MQHRQRLPNSVTLSSPGAWFYAGSHKRPRSNAMHIGVPSDIKIHEYPMGLTRPPVAKLVTRGHQVTIAPGPEAPQMRYRP